MRASQVRDDLLALGETELVALANRGLWKKAGKELQKGEFEFSLGEDNTIKLIQGESTVTILPHQSLSDCTCSCSATGMCRHKLLAVLAYQERNQSAVVEQEWCPSEFSDDEVHDLLGANLFKRARGQTKKGLRIRLHRGSKPKAFLPTCTVSFLVPHQLSYARCDCAQIDACEHLALACWAFREEGDEIVFEQSARIDDYDFTACRSLLDDLLLHGVRNSHPKQIEALRQQSRNLSRSGLIWLSNLLQEMAETVSAYQQRGSHFSPQGLARLLLDWWVRSSAEDGSRTVLWGAGITPETALKQVALTALGARIDHRAGETVVNLYLADPKAGVVTVIRKQWEGRLLAAEVAEKRFAGNLPLKRLANTQVVTEAAKRLANRELLLGKGRVGKTTALIDSGNWSERFQEPLLVRDFERLKDELKTEEPIFFRARVRAESIRILEIDEVGEVVYLPGSQTLEAELYDRDTNPVLLRLVHRAGEPSALQECAQQLSRGVRFVAGKVSLQKGEVHLEPLSVVTNRPYCLALATTESGLDEVSVARAASQIGPEEQAWEHCLVPVLSGLKLVDRRWHEECRELSNNLRSSGYQKLAEHFEKLSHEGTTTDWYHAALRAWLLGHT